MTSLSGVLVFLANITYFAKITCVKGVSTKSASTKVTCTRNAYKKAASIENAGAASIRSVSTIKNLEMHLQSFQISEVKIFGAKLKTRIGFIR